MFLIDGLAGNWESVGKQSTVTMRHCLSERNGTFTKIFGTFSSGWLKYPLLFLCVLGRPFETLPKNHQKDRSSCFVVLLDI